MNLFELCKFVDEMEKQQEKQQAEKPAEQQLTLAEAIEADRMIGEMEKKHEESTEPFFVNGRVNWKLLFAADRYAAEHPEVV